MPSRKVREHITIFRKAFSFLVIFRQNFKIGLWMFAGRASLWCRCALINIAAIDAMPFDGCFLRKDLFIDNVFDQGAIAGFMIFFDLGDLIESPGNFFKTFIFRHITEI